MNKIQQILKAIRKINPDAVMNIVGEDINTCKIEWVEGTTPISKDDIKTQIPVVVKEMEDALIKKTTDKASADAKLKALGLTDDEIEAFRS
jgi:predicted GTPase|tara:strand:- start:3005 stop:3277 length:273 start_codon:yes stop_codon:yes gene_type:complete